MKPRFGQEGLTATQLAVVMPALLFFVMLIVQYGLWAHAKQVATAAAAEGVDAGQVPGATATTAEQAARSFLASSGNLEEVTVTVGPAGSGTSSGSVSNMVEVRVDGRAPRLVPGFSWRVTAVATAPRERFVPESERLGSP